MRRGTWLAIGLVILLVPTLLHMYLLNPFPGSQKLDSIVWAYYLAKILRLTQIVGGLIAGLAAVAIVRGRRTRWTLAWVVALVLVSSGLVCAPKLVGAASFFTMPKRVQFAKGASRELPAATLVMGIAHNGEVKAYPLRLLAFHHQVEDTLGGQPVLVTYCTMCRTGRVFARRLGERTLSFELIGAVKYNAVFADRATGTWWYQANGRAVVGPLTGARMTELPAENMMLGQWLKLHPESEVLQPDPASADGYKAYDFDKYDAVRPKPHASPDRDWLIVVTAGGSSRAYPWSLLKEKRCLADTLGSMPVALLMDDDGYSVRAFDRRIGERTLDLRCEQQESVLIDDASGARFGFDGVARDGALGGATLNVLPASLELRRAFEAFSGTQSFTPPSSPPPPTSPRS